MAWTPSDDTRYAAAKYAAYRSGYQDAQRGRFAPPKDISLIDRLLAPFDRLSGSPPVSLTPAEKVAAYRQGHAAYGDER